MCKYVSLINSKSDKCGEANTLIDSKSDSEENQTKLKCSQIRRTLAFVPMTYRRILTQKLKSEILKLFLSPFDLGSEEHLPIRSESLIWANVTENKVALLLQNVSRNLIYPEYVHITLWPASVLRKLDYLPKRARPTYSSLTQYSDHCPIASFILVQPSKLKLESLWPSLWWLAMWPNCGVAFDIFLVFLENYKY